MDQIPKPDQSFSELTTQIKKLNRSYSVWGSFVRGIASGFGSVVGATLVVAVAVWLLNKMQIVPLIGNWFAEIISNAQQNILTP